MSNIKTKKIKDMKISLPSKSAFPIETKKNMIKLNTLLLAVGRKGTGKNASVCSLIKMLCDDNVLDEVVVATPTYESNKDYFLQFGTAFDPENNIILPSKDTATMIESFVQGVADYYDDYLKQMKQYQELKKRVKSGLSDDDIDMYYQMELLNESGMIIKPEYKYKNKPPRVFALVDDSIGTDTFIGNGAKKMVSLALTHRHLGKFADEKGEDQVLGCSLAILTQTLKTMQGGVPKSIRINCSVVILVGKTNDEKMNHSIWEELSSFIDEEEFMKIWDYACPQEEPHSFLMVDLAPKCNLKTFRKNFDEFIIPPNTKCKCKKPEDKLIK